MKNYILSFVLPMFFVGCLSGNYQSESQADDPSESEAVEIDKLRMDHTIEPAKRVGMVTAYSTEGQILKLYGEHVIRKSIPIAEGNELPGLVLFPGTENEAEVVWDPAVSVNKPVFVRISKDHTQWKTTSGVTIGTSLEELEKINGRPFSFYGFEWDYAGLVNSWMDGEIHSNLVIALIPGNYDNLGADLMGDVILRSDDPRLKGLDLKVGSMVIRFQ